VVWRDFGNDACPDKLHIPCSLCSKKGRSLKHFPLGFLLEVTAASFRLNSCDGKKLAEDLQRLDIDIPVQKIVHCNEHVLTGRKYRFDKIITNNYKLLLFNNQLCPLCQE
jgi:hypothetical protein